MTTLRPVVALLVLLFAQAKPTGTLVVRVTGIGSEKAAVRIALFNFEQTWLNDAVAMNKTVLEGETPEREWRVENLPSGEYGVAVFLDKNRDGKLNRNFLGIPREPYGFSNNARRAVGPAYWKDAKFAVAAEEKVIAIEVK